MTTTAETPATCTAVDAARDRLRRQDAGAPAPGERLDIAEVAARTGVTAHTLRYYERIGLLAVERDASGHRSYSADDFRRVVFVSRLRMTGMPVREVQRYVELSGRGEGTVPDRLELLEAHRDAVRAQLTELTLALATIEHKIEVYGGAMAP